MAALVPQRADRARGRRRAVDVLIVEGEAVDHDVRQVDGADPGVVAQPRAAVDQRHVVVGPHIRRERVQE
jgi:hypothetical protein